MRDVGMRAVDRAWALCYRAGTRSSLVRAETQPVLPTRSARLERHVVSRWRYYGRPEEAPGPV